MKASVSLFVRHSSSNETRYVKYIACAGLVLTSLILIRLLIFDHTSTENQQKPTKIESGERATFMQSNSSSASIKFTRRPVAARDLDEGSKLTECAIDCNFDADCSDALLCAKNKSGISDWGYNPSKVYCGGYRVGTSGSVCYDPSKLQVLLGECEWSCLSDRECGDGLLCAKDHTSELEMFGLDTSRAYCTLDFSDTVSVCYDPTKPLGCEEKQFVLNNQCCMLISFDDIQVNEDKDGNAYSKISDVYQGFSFTNVYAQRIPPNDTIFGYNTGYRFGTMSLPNHAFNEYGKSFVMAATERPFGGENVFALDSMYITPGFLNNIQIQLLGLNEADETIVATGAVLTDIKTPSIVLLEHPQFNAISKLIITASSSTPDNDPKPKNGEPLHLVVDDIIVCSP